MLEGAGITCIGQFIAGIISMDPKQERSPHELPWIAYLFEAALMTALLIVLFYRIYKKEKISGKKGTLVYALITQGVCFAFLTVAYFFLLPK